jgi:hypothetical protein
MTLAANTQIQSQITLIITATSIVATTANCYCSTTTTITQQDGRIARGKVMRTRSASSLQSERASAEEEEAAHHGDERDGLDGGDDPPERSVQEERHVAHKLRPRPRLRLPPPLESEERGRRGRGEQRGQAGQAEVRRPPEHGQQAAAHGPTGASRGRRAPPQAGLSLALLLLLGRGARRRRGGRSLWGVGWGSLV